MIGSIPDDDGAWEYIASIDEVSSNHGIVRSISGEDIALFLIGDSYRAVSNHCPHQHFSSLADGSIEGTEITCPMHGWRFDLITGENLSEGGHLRQFDLKLEGGKIFVLLNGEADYCE